jgi:hypothetical protein
MMKASFVQKASSRFVVIALAGALLGLTGGCQTLREATALRDVAFDIDRVTDARLAGVRLNDIRSYNDIGAADMLRLSAAIAEGEMPFSFTLYLEGTNPEGNSVDARLTEMDWTLLLNDRETISGVFDREVVMPPGEPTPIPIDIELDAIAFFDNNLRDIVELALAVGGEGPPQNVKLRARPTINTAVGPIQYPGSLTVVNRDVGSAE